MRTVLLILVCTLLMSLLGALWHLVVGRPMLADIPLLLVLYLALTKRREPVLVGARPACMRLLVSSEVLTVLVLGYVTDLMAATPKGLHALALGLVYLSGRLVRHRLDFGSVRGQVVLACLASLVLSSVILGVRWHVNGVGGPAALVPVGMHALVTATLAAPVIRLFTYLDDRLDRQPFGSTLIE